MTRASAGALMIALMLSAIPFLAFSDTTDELQKQIDDNNAQVALLNKEIAEYEAQLKTTTTEKNTLQNKISQLDLQRKKLQASIAVTQKQLSTTQTQITTLKKSITQKEATIESDHSALAESLRRLSRVEKQPLAYAILSAHDISDAWTDAEAEAQLQDAVNANIQRLAGETAALSTTKTAAEEKRQLLMAQQQKLSTQQGSLNATRQSQAELLAQTKNKEATYQQILAQKQAAKKDFEDTLNLLQAKLKSADTSSVPSAGFGVFSWPLEAVYITQYFGDTAFARTAAYKGKGHNGIDFRAPVGTPVHSVLTGVVQAINLGSAPNCQYGKWVLVKHGNGLTTLYAHLSSIKVAEGQNISTGEIIGYSGDTGYATGPHLHMTVYVSSAVSFVQYRCNSGKTVTIPVSPFNGYLNPILYLPAA